MASSAAASRRVALLASAAGAALLLAVRGFRAWKLKRRREVQPSCETRCIPSHPWSSRAALPSRQSPCVFRKVPLGSCTECWTDEYLVEAAGDLKVSAHVSETAHLDFAAKNFAYEVMNFREFLRRTEVKHPDGRYLYYRSQHVKRNKPSSLEIIGSLAADFNLPEELAAGFDVHSTVLRAATPGLCMWLHYDVCDNFLCCVRGCKRVVVLEPSEIGRLYITGSSSAMGSRVFGDAVELRSLWTQFPLAEGAWARRWEAVLEDGDVLYIPAFWPHCTQALPSKHKGKSGASISVNTFLLRPEAAALHDPRDVWANRELLPAQEAVKAVEEKALPALRRLPEVPRAFYCRKLAAVLLSAAEAADVELHQK